MSAPLFPIRRMALTAFVVAVAALAGLAGSANAATQLANVTFQDPGVSPGSGLGWGVYNFAIDHDGANEFPFATGVKRGHCVEAEVDGANGVATLKTDADVALNPPPPNADQANRIAWLLLSSIYNQDTPDASTLTLDQRGDAHQSAIWQYTDPNAPDIVSPDQATADEATRLIAEAELNKNASQQAASIGVTGVVTCNGGTRGVEVKGAPFSTATLTITSANATFPGGVTEIDVPLGPSGTGSTTVTAGVGTVTISATVLEAKLVMADFAETQDLVYTENTPVDLSLSIDFPPCTPPPPPPPVTPAKIVPKTVTPTQTRRAVRARLRIAKRGPRRARAGGVIRYRIVVRNRAGVRARNVVITDRLPRGMVLAKRTRGMTIRGRTLRIRVGSIGPRTTIRRTVTVRVLSSTRGRRCNAATVNASNAPRVRSRTCTRVIRIRPRIAPAVTG